MISMFWWENNNLNVSFLCSIRPLQHKEIMAAIIRAHKEAKTFADAVSETREDHTGGMITHQGLMQHNASQGELQQVRQAAAVGLGIAVPHNKSNQFDVLSARADNTK
jgi:hypothetical protein